MNDRKCLLYYYLIGSYKPLRPKGQEANELSKMYKQARRQPIC